MLERISAEIQNQTFHWHAHLLADLPIKAGGFYLEIGCYAGATASLMISKEEINVVSIDLGSPILEEIARENVSKFNKRANPFWYIKGNSREKSTRLILKSITKTIDILFIDGDHSFDGVIFDFLNYSPLVAIGGFIVFDDYNDDTYSPEVKPAVNYIVSRMLGTETVGEYEVWGTFRNSQGARPDHLEDGNCFILRKIK